MSNSRSPLIQSLAFRQSPLTVTVEIIFALLLVAVFWISREQFFPSSDLPLESFPPRSPIATPLAGSAGAAALALPAIEADVAQICEEQVVNGGFEETGIWRIPITARPAAYTSERAAEGDRSLRLGIDENDQPAYSDSTAYQFVTLPADAEEILLNLQLWRTAGGTGNDFQYIFITANGVTTALLRERTNDPQWTGFRYDLTRFAGSQIRLLFGVFNGGQTGRAAMYVDAVSIQSCRAAGENETPTVTPTAQLTGTVTATATFTATATLTATRTVTPTVMPSTTPTPPSNQGDGRLFLPSLFGLRPTPRPASPTPTATPSPTATPDTGATATPTATITPSATPTSPPSACRNLIVNGDFEADDGWTRPITARPANYSETRALGGSRSMRLGISAQASNVRTDSTAYQWIQLPAQAGQILLRTHLWRSGGDNDDLHYLWFIVGGPGGRTIRVVQSSGSEARWEPVEFDLTSLAGQRIMVLLGTFNGGSGQRAIMFVDDLSVLSCDQEAPVATPRPTPTGQPGFAPPATMSSPDFGAQAFLWWRPAIAERDLELMKSAGFRWVRQGFAWETIEGAAKGAFDWSQSDRVVKQVNDSGLNLLARLGVDPELEEFWAGHPPESLDDFVDYVAALARRYRCTPDAVGCIQAYQVWNEPNLAREWGGNRPVPDEYVTMLGKVYAAIKAANPNALVITAGMAPTGTDNEIAMPDERYYRELYQAMNGNSDGYFDLLGVHASGFAAPPEIDPEEAVNRPEYGGHRFFSFRHAEDIRAIMVANGDQDKKMAILEFGWTNDPVNPDYLWFGAQAGIDEFVKADYLRRAYEWAGENWPWVGLMSLLTMPNLDWLEDGDPFDEEQYWWAILEPSELDELRLRPAYVELCVYFNRLSDRICEYDPAQD